MENIEKFIQFAIDNKLVYKNHGLKKIYEIGFNDVDIFYLNDRIITINTIELITSKPFIEAVARGITKLDIQKEFYDNFRNSIYSEDLEDVIAQVQAIHIRDDKLNEFINDLLPND